MRAPTTTRIACAAALCAGGATMISHGQTPGTTPATAEPAAAAHAPDGTTAAPAPATQPAAPAAPDAAGAHDFDFFAGGGYLHQFNATIDNGAQMSVDRFYAGFSSRLVKSDGFSLTLGMGYEFDWYHWKGTSSLGTSDPFGSVNLFALQVRGRYEFADQWAVGLTGIFGIAGESSADAGSSLYGGGIASVAWAPHQDMLLGLGVLGVTQLEDDPLVLPIPVIHWRFAEEWVLSSVRRPPASPFVGVDVAYEPVDSPVDLSLGLAWQQRRFRLGPNTAANLNNGVGEDQSFAMLATIGYDFSPNIRLDLLGGFNFYEKLQVENSSGRQIRDATVDPSAMLGVFLTVRF